VSVVSEDDSGIHLRTLGLTRPKVVWVSSHDVVRAVAEFDFQSYASINDD
jgi:hypothetical protein